MRVIVVPAWSANLTPNRWDLVALPAVLGLVALLAYGANQMAVPFVLGDPIEITLDPTYLPYYALRTTLRMGAALIWSFVFTLVYATLAAKNRRAGLVLVPILDVLQSVPILGYISFTVTGFVAMFPGSLLGVEMAAIFAIFTSQAWNMTFSLYQALRTLPSDLVEAATLFRLSGWQKFWRLELPFAAPGLIWNTMMSVSGGWFFVVASEAITVGEKKMTLPGIGSYVALAIEQRNLGAVGWAVLAMFIVILLYDQLLFRPMVAWADKFKVEQSPGIAPRSWVRQLFQRTHLLRQVSFAVGWLLRLAFALGPATRATAKPRRPRPPIVETWIDRVYYATLVIAALAAAAWMLNGIETALGWAEVGHVAVLGLITGVRVVVLIALATLVWVPAGVYIGLRPRLTERVQPLVQFLAAFPANLLFPVAVVGIVSFHLDPNIWLSPLMIFGSMWYVLFNVVAGASAFPSDLKDAAANLGLSGWQWWRRVMLPAIFPYFVTGAITASGGSWNASVVAESVSWGDTSIAAVGLGAYIAEWTEKGEYARIALGVGMLSLFVVAFNRLFWRPLYALAERRYRMD
ncbi:MAG: ABC transporter permease subunit [Proteobacteria bacterium]|nr:ABC transporter permease subunit [Pseudomonadota bacterium]MBI3497509.1 ABC transporter permease subunit [Pseudomonadota bacterium]